MQITAEMDAGDVYMRREFDIGENDTNADVEHRVSEIGADMLVKYLANPSEYHHNLVRALGAGRTRINGVDVKILETRVEDGLLKILRIQPAGKKPMDWKSFCNGLRGAEIKFGE